MIYRKHSTDNFVVLEKTALYDDKLSWKAKGLHSYLMSLPCHWKIFARELSARSRDGYSVVASAMNELEEAGYVIKRRVQAGWDYEIHESRQVRAKNNLINL